MPRISEGDDWGFQPPAQPADTQAIRAESEALNAPNRAAAQKTQMELQREFREANPPGTRNAPYQGPVPGATTVDNPVGQFMEDLTVGIIDAVTPQTREEIQEERTQARTQSRLQAEAAKYAAAEATPPVLQPVIGGALKAAEGVVDTVDLLDDTIKGSLFKRAYDAQTALQLLVDETSGGAVTFPSLIGPLNPRDDVFSSDYEALNFDLNSSNYAQTGIGAVAKEFIAFGLTLGLTGGFRGAGTATGAIITSVKQGRGIVGAGGGVVASGAARGIIADLMQNPEDGNLSNTIRENAPEWYPTWLTALAVEEDDNPWIARLKTGLEGAGLGEAADGLMSLFMGYRAARKARKAGKSVEEAAEIGEEAARAYEAGMVGARPRPTVWSETAQRFQNQKYFKLGTRNIQALDTALVPWDKLQRGEISGFTVNPETGEEAVSGFMVNIDGAKDLKDFSPQAISEWLTDNAEPLSRPDTFIGGYIDEDGVPVLEIARQIMDRDEAVRLGVEFDQETIYDVAAGRLSRGEGVQGELDLTTDGQLSLDLPNVNTDPVVDLKGPITPPSSEVSFPPSQAQREAAAQRWNSDPGRAEEFSNTRFDELTPEQQAEVIRVYTDARKIPVPKPAGSPKPYIRTAGVSDVGMTRNSGFRDLQFRPNDPTPQVTARNRELIGEPSSTKTIPQEVSAADMTDAAVSQSKVAFSDIRPTSKTIITKASMKILGAGQRGQDLLAKFTKKDPDLQRIANETGQSVGEIRAEAAEAMARFNGDPRSLGTEIVRGTEVYTDAGLVAAKTLIGDISSRLAESVVQVRRLGDNGMDSMPAVVKMVDEMKALLATYKYTSQVFGRSLNNFKIPALGIEVPNFFSKATPETVKTQVKETSDLLDKLVKDLASGDPAVVKNAEVMAGRLALAGGDPALLRSVSSHLGGALMKSGLQAFYNSMLSGVKTQLVNNLSNGMNAFYRPAQAWMGSFWMADGKGKIQRKAAAATYAAMWQNMSEAWKVANLVWQNGGNAINDGGKGLVRAAETAAELKLLETIAAEQGDPAFKWGVKMVSSLNSLVNNPLLDWPSRMLTTSDEFFKTFVARNEFNTRAWMEAAEMTGEAAGDQTQAMFEALLKKHADSAFDSVSGAILDRKLLESAKESTFQTDLEGMAANFARLVEGVPILRVFFPFIKTGHNIMVYTAEHVPILNRRLVEYDKVMKSGDELAIAQMKGREATGIFVIGTAGMLAMSGNLTGNGPSDPEQRKSWLENNKVRSIKVPGTDIWIDYSRFEPFNMILGAVGDVFQALRDKELSEDQAEYLMGHLAFSISSNLTQKSYYAGLVPFGQILQPNQTGASKFATMSAETLNNVLPYAGLRRNLTNMMNPYMMEFSDEMERLKFQASGGLIGEAAPRYDWLKNDGQAMYSPSGGGNAVWPYKVSTRKQDTVRDELEDIGLEVSEIGLRSGVELSPTMISMVTKEMGDGRLYSAIKRLQGSKAYQESKEKAMRDLKEGNPDFARAGGRKGYYYYTETMALISQARTDAVNRLYYENDKFRQEADAINNAKTRAQLVDSNLNIQDNKHLQFLLDMPN